MALMEMTESQRLLLISLFRRHRTWMISLIWKKILRKVTTLPPLLPRPPHPPERLLTLRSSMFFGVFY
jgi:hypothetical protein